MAQHHYKSILRHGKVKGETYFKNVSGSVHRLKRPPAWALSCADLAEAERQGAVRIEILDIETQITYATSIENFRARALPVNRGYGPQMALEIKHWGIVAPLTTGGISAVKFGKVERPQPQQLGLFQEVNHG